MGQCIVIFPRHRPHWC